ncbi:MAG TPA: tetratricopeptide repeat protein [Isosphaeraceae bacterium]|jgi:tetratricopeptide (TPR) repeat protein|nr:tetratricopeptide repeat protein [Isosphaeraceae bacterium]
MKLESPPPSPIIAEGRPRLRRLRSRLAGLAFWAVVVALLSWNGWRLYRDFRPLPDLRTISSWLYPARTGKAQVDDAMKVAPERLDEAEWALRERLRRSPHDGEARMLLARVCDARNDLLACARELAKVPDWWPTKSEALYFEGKAYLRLGRAREAEAAWSACISPEPARSLPDWIFDEVANALLEIYAYEERWEEARALIWRYYDISPAEDHPTILIMRLRTELERVAYDQAEARLRRYAAADPTDFDARLALARAAEANGEHEEASGQVAACLAAWPADPRVWVVDLEILDKQGDSSGLAAAAAAAPTSPDAWRYRGRARVETPALTAADDHYLAEISKFRGLVRERSGDWPAAAAEYRKAIHLVPSQEEYHYRLSRVEVALGRADAAGEELARYRTLHQARTDLVDAYSDYLDAYKGRPGARDLGAAIDRLTALSRTLGWTRESLAWARLMPPKPADGF